MKAFFQRHRKGSLLISSVILMMVLVLTGAAFMKWASDEAHQASFDLARTQAYYIAQRGALDRGLNFLLKKPIAQLPSGGTTPFEDGELTSYGDYVGRYVDTKLVYTGIVDDANNEFVQSRSYDIRSTGVVYVPESDGTVGAVTREMTLRAQMRSYADYMYLTDHEVTQFGEVIWFWTPDTLYGRVHSNDQIGIKYSPVFLGPVSTCADDFLENAATPYFAYDPVFNAPIVEFPTEATEVRGAAGATGNYLNDNEGQWQTMIVGGDNGWEYYQWDLGTPFDPNNLDNQGSIPYTLNTVIFVEGPLYIKGDAIQMRSTVASEGNMYLIDDVRYRDVSQTTNPTIPEGSTNILGLISESNIIIANTWENGRGNGATDGPQSNHDRKHIIITAGLISLGESFTFEDQNDIGDDYYWCDPQGDHAGQADERGKIFLRGAVAQSRRGYVHRSNCGGTGYDKNYRYDFRFQLNPPPVYLTAKDKDGKAFFDIVSSWDSDPDREYQQ